MKEEKKKIIIKAIAKIVGAIISGIAIGWLSKLNLEAGVPLPYVIGVAAGLVLLVS